MLQSPKKKNKKKAKHAYTQVGVAEFGDRLLRYSDLQRDDTGWITNMRFRPHNFDLVFLKIKGRDKPVSAWWTGIQWEGRLWKPEYKVIAWKRNENWD